MQTFRFMVGAVVALLCAPAFAQTPAKKPPVKKPPVNQVKGQTQLSGANGQFGTVYTLETGFNYAITGAAYTLEPLLTYSALYVGKDEKLLVVRIAIKNSNPSDNTFDGGNHRLIAVDAENQNHEGYGYMLQSQPSKGFYGSLRPGQGVGQGNDPLLVGIKVPAKARIVKIMLNQGRKGRNEEVVRYYVAGATKAEAGEDGDPKNAIAPLPVEFRAAGDATGAILASPLPPKIGAFVTSGAFALRVDSVTYSTTETYNGAPPEEGKQFLIAAVTAKYIGQGEAALYSLMRGAENAKLTDADGEEATFIGTRKAKSDEDPTKQFNSGDSYAFRVLFSLSKNAKAGKLRLGAGDGPLYEYDLSEAK